MRIGLLGAGRIGRIHGGNIAAHARAACGGRRRRRRGGAPPRGREQRDNCLQSMHHRADKDIDAVLICTPTDTHADLIERAARAGKAVFCEKPVDLDAARIRTCLDVVKRPMPSS